MSSLLSPWTQCLDVEINTGLAAFFGGGGTGIWKPIQAKGQLPGKEGLLAESAGSDPPPLPVAVNLPLAGLEIQAQGPVKGQHFCVGSFMETA